MASVFRLSLVDDGHELFVGRLATDGSGGSSICLGSHYAKPVSKWVTAECDRRTGTTFKFLLALGAAVQYLRYDPFKIFDVEVDVNGSPVTFISTRVVRTFCWLGASRLLHQSDLRTATFQNDIRCDRTGQLNETQSIAMEAKPFVKIWNVDCN
jgi:hypothetical protein